MKAKEQRISQEKIIEYLRTAIFDGNCGLNDVPNLIKRVIKEDLWQERTLAKTNEIIKFRTFEEFLQTSPPEGLGTNLKTIRKLCHEDIAAIDLIEQVKTKRFHGGDRRSQDFKRNNVTVEISKRGNAKEYSLKRLRKERPELHQAILDGKLTVNQAMIKANFRKQKYQIEKDVEKISLFIKKHFTTQEIQNLILHLQK
jgi:hypothetical protein